MGITTLVLSRNATPGHVKGMLIQELAVGEPSGRAAIAGLQRAQVNLCTSVGTDHLHNGQLKAKSAGLLGPGSAQCQPIELNLCGSI